MSPRSSRLLAACVLGLPAIVHLLTLGRAHAAERPIRVVTLGDSITKGARPGVLPEETFASRLQEALIAQGHSVIVSNVGLGGEEAGQGLARLQRDVASLQPDYVTIMYGTNDSYIDQGRTKPRVPLPLFRDQLRQLVTRLRDIGAEPILMTEPRYAKVSPLNGLGEHCNIRLEAYIRATREVAAEQQVQLIDNWTGWLQAEQAGTDLRDWTTDGYHPNPQGHTDIANRMAAVLSQLWTARQASAVFKTTAISNTSPDRLEAYPTLRPLPGLTLWPAVEVPGATVWRQPGALFISFEKGNTSGQIVLPRLDNVVRRCWWKPASEPWPAPLVVTTAGEYERPWVHAADRLVQFSQTPNEWLLQPPSQSEPCVVVLEVEGTPLHHAGAIAQLPAADGTVTLSAYAASVTGEKLQFEPLPHKNTVGYWVNPHDFASWRFQLDRAGKHEVHVLQGCGGGQGGSEVEIAVGASRLSFSVEETGHFQNFRWRTLGVLQLEGSDVTQVEQLLTLKCLRLNKNAVMDVRQIRLVPVDTTGPIDQDNPAPDDIRDITPDAWLPPLASSAPASGRRCLHTAPGFENTRAYHSVWLPTDWQAGQKWPVLIEFTGNGGFVNELGDVCTGRVEDARLGYGLGGGDGQIWLSVPYLNSAGTANVSTWWGTAPEYDPAATLRYLKASLSEAITNWGGDPDRVTLLGFSRGAIAVNALGLHDDETASLWQRSVCFSHYDGVRAWPVPGSDPASAAVRFSRLGSRSQFVCSEDQRQLAETMAWIKQQPLANGNFEAQLQFEQTGYRNHNDAWSLRPGQTRERIKNWLNHPETPPQ